MDQDIYSAPQSKLIEEKNTDLTLASRWARLFASIIDTFALLLILGPIMYLTGMFDSISEGGQTTLMFDIFMALTGFFTFFIINGWLLIKDGQTVGKKLLKIKIVDLNGHLPSWQPHYIIRYAVYFFPGQIPIIGQFISLADVLFIFGKDKRCLHDLAAGTIVVDA